MAAGNRLHFLVRVSMRSLTRRAFALFLVLSVGGCGDSDPAPVGPEEESSFALLQSELFAQRCVGCHAPGTPEANESGLVLTGADVFEALVGVAPANAAAASAGMLRVKPGNPDLSLLYHKLQRTTPVRYGAEMPLGGDPVSVGQLQFVREWIEAGAPRTGAVADRHLLHDNTPQTVAAFVPLPPPQRGVQLRIDAFAIAPNFEREIFVYRRVGNAAPLYVNRIETRMRPGSHHFVAYTFAPTAPAAAVPPFDEIRDLRRANGSLISGTLASMPYHVFFGGSMTAEYDYSLPAGVALELPAHAGIDLNSHYVNRTTREMAGEVYLNLHTVDASSVTQVARALNLSNFEIRLPAGARTTMTKTFVMTDTTRVLMLTSHMHELGEKFVVRIAGGPRDGEVVYTSTSWQHPPMITYEPAIVLRPGEGLTSEITYNNTRNRVVTFGLTSEDEMGIIFGYIY